MLIHFQFCVITLPSSGNIIDEFLCDGNWEAIPFGTFPLHLQVFLDGVGAVVSTKVRLLAGDELHSVFNGQVTDIRNVR